MGTMSDYTQSVRARAGRLFSQLAKSRQHHGRPVQGSLFAEDIAQRGSLSAGDVEALLCLAMVRELSEGDWDRVLTQYGLDSARTGCPVTAAEVEEAFYLAMFRTCKAEVWMPVVQCFERLKEEPVKHLEMMGRAR